MRINTNVSAVNTLRQLGKTNQALGKAFGRLSSGFRINTAADDAAGLGIANKLRADVRSLQQASRNAEQANSLLQVAEGAGQVIQGIVERMKELATQSASDNTTTDGRTKIHAEFVALRAEIARVVDTTQFQGQTLLNGSLGNVVDTADAAHTMDTVAAVQSITITGTQAATYDVDQTADAVTMDNGSMTQTVSGLVAGQQIISFSLFGIDLEVDSTFSVTGGSETFNGEDIVVAGGDTAFMVSSSGDYHGQDLITLAAMDLQVTTLGIDAANGDLSDASAARDTLANIDSALSVIAGVFGEIGAAQNRLEFSRHNVDTAVENFMAAESVIRDADMAAEVTIMTKYQILQQAGTAVLAQANAAPQGVLQLLS